MKNNIISRSQRVKSLLTPNNLITDNLKTSYRSNYFKPPNLVTSKNKSLRMSFYVESPGFNLKDYTFKK